MYADLKEAAARGARKCDEMVPGWYGKINTASLDIASPRHCICGQLGGTYSSGLKLLNILYIGGATYGFSSRGAGSMQILTQAWKEEIASRLLSDEFAASSASESSAVSEPKKMVGV